MFYVYCHLTLYYCLISIRRSNGHYVGSTEKRERGTEGNSLEVYELYTL